MQCLIEETACRNVNLSTTFDKNFLLMDWNNLKLVELNSEVVDLSRDAFKACSELKKKLHEI